MGLGPAAVGVGFPGLVESRIARLGPASSTKSSKTAGARSRLARLVEAARAPAYTARFDNGGQRRPPSPEVARRNGGVGDTMLLPSPSAPATAPRSCPGRPGLAGHEPASPARWVTSASTGAGLRCPLRAARLPLGHHRLGHRDFERRRRAGSSGLSPRLGAPETRARIARRPRGSASARLRARRCRRHLLNSVADRPLGQRRAARRRLDRRGSAAPSPATVSSSPGPHVPDRRSRSPAHEAGAGRRRACWPPSSSPKRRDSRRLIADASL
jgi:hypothetical protein